MAQKKTASKKSHKHKNHAEQLFAELPRELNPPEHIFHKYLSTRQILVCDTSLQFRTSIAKLLRDLGAQTQNILLTSSYSSAVHEIQANRPEIIISEFHLGTQNGLKLIHHQKRQLLEPDHTLFILVTADANETSIAQAAEEEVDSYIIKPFSQEVFREHIIRCALAKIQPDPYRRAIQEGKSHLANLKIREALEEFRRARSLHERPALAWYYLGQAHLAENDEKAAETSFRQGLSIAPIHYRCLTGLFDLLLQANRFKDAYETGKKLLGIFPITPQRLERLIKLAIQNELFEDTDRYFWIFQDMEYRTPELTRCISAALVVSGRRYLETGEKQRALATFERAVSSSSRSPMILKEIIPALLEEKELKQAERFLKFFPAHTRSDPTYLTMEILFLNEIGTTEQILLEGRKALKKGVTDPRIFEILIRRATAKGMSRAAEALAWEAAKFWPDQTERFLELMTPSKA